MPTEETPPGDKQRDEQRDEVIHCRICGKPVADEQYLPFCSSRCRLIDLGNWADGSYTISRTIEQRDLEEDD